MSDKNESPKKDDTPGASSPNGGKGKGKGKAKPKAVVPSTSMELRSSTDDRQPLIPTESATEGQSLPPIPREESMDTGDIQSEAMEVSESSDSQMAPGSKGSDPPSIAFRFDDMEDSPSLSKRARKGDLSDPSTDPSDQVISITSDGQIELEPIPGPSGLQPPVSPSTSINIHESAGYKDEVARVVAQAAEEYAREVAASPTITSAHSRATTFLSSVLCRVVNHQLPSPPPPQVQHWSDAVFTLSKYTAYLAFLMHSFGVQHALWVAKQPYQKRDGPVWTMFFFELVGMFFMLGGSIHGHNNWFILAIFCYIPLLFCYGPDINVFTCWWTICSFIFIGALSARIATWEKCKPIDIVHDWREYFQRLRAREVIEPPSYTIRSATRTPISHHPEIESETGFTTYPKVESQGESRVTISSEDSRPSQVISPTLDISETRGSTPSATTSRNVSRAGMRSGASNIIETVAIIEQVPPQDDSTDSGETAI